MDKVKLGESLLSKLIDESIINKYSQDQLIEKCFQLLSHDTYNSKILYSDDFEKFAELKYSILFLQLFEIIIMKLIPWRLGNITEQELKQLYYWINMGILIIMKKYS